MPSAASYRSLLLAGSSAAPVFMASFVIQQSLREDYDPRRYPVSSLALGPGGGQQAATFAVTGGLLALGAAGLGDVPVGAEEPRAVVVMLAGAAVGLLASAVFTTDPIGGYPPGTAVITESRTREGLAHDMSAVPVFLGLPVAAVVSGVAAARSGRWGWAVYSGVAAAGTVVGLVRSSGGFGHQRTQWVAQAGTWQRVAIVAGLGWASAVCGRAAIRSSRR
ncbi:MAG TPA: DUF998 domain-containing protein [Pedococcus sp.]|nr:DUF998 domain-containing protein [Pedococcus sp.]